MFGDLIKVQPIQQLFKAYGKRQKCEKVAKQVENFSIIVAVEFPDPRVLNRFHRAIQSFLSSIEPVP